jgi:galactokinase|tara:strand:+ start:459 stop:602 length:144 start_codon:yes stop_codon:yes gene_type:complete
VKSGALGSKSSGAGWGGCCVSLVHKDNLDKTLEEMKTYYSREREEDK